MIIYNLKKKKFIKKILSFIYYLRYLILIFLFSIILLFTIPKLFNYVDKIEDLNNTLKNQHSFRINNAEKIIYKVFPQPGLEIQNTNISIEGQSSNLIVKKLKIFTNLKGLYNLEKILVKKIFLEEISLNINKSNYKDYLKFIKNNSIILKDLTVNFKDKVISFQNINLKKTKKEKTKFNGNFLGNKIKGHYTDQKKKKLLYFKVKNLGIESIFFFDTENTLFKPSGIMKLKILDDNFIINFNYDQNLKLKDSIYKNKNIFTNFNGQFDFKPFFYFKIFTDVKKMNFDNLNIKKFYSFITNEILNKKLNGELIINYFPKKLKGNTINLLFQNGDIISKNSSFQFANLKIKVSLNLKSLPTYKNLDYQLLVKTDNINKFYRTIGQKREEKIEYINALIRGSVNLNAKKYYFDEIIVNEKKLKTKKLIKMKDFFDKNLDGYFNGDINKKNIYLFVRDLIDFI